MNYERQFLIETFKRDQKDWLHTMLKNGDVVRIEIDESQATLNLFVNAYHYLVLGDTSVHFDQWTAVFNSE